MKILLCSLNAKYVHTNLAIRHLGRVGQKYPGHTVWIRDYTINQPLDAVVQEIHRLQPDWIALSVYIWNRQESLRLIRKLKRINPRWVILVGGPEVAFDPGQLLLREPDLDLIVSGEGEKPFAALLEGIPHADIPGLTYRDGERIHTNAPGAPTDMESLDFPYDLPLPPGAMVYYESSRGCPYRCAYCMSALERKVRMRSLEKVQADLMRFIEAGAPVVKFVDRTFNVDKERSFRLMRWIMENDRGHATFHMELAPHLIDRDWTELLRQARPGLFQFEIGIQSTDPAVIRAIDRNQYFEAYRDSLLEFLTLDNVHTHVDLIAGLPGEDRDSFYRSFDAVHDLNADHFQLGFLKLLRGSPIMQRLEHYGYVYDPAPPYEVIRSDHMEAGDLLEIKVVEELLEMYRNSHLFDASMAYAVPFAQTPSVFYRAFAAYWTDQGLFGRKMDLATRFGHLEQFVEETYPVHGALLKDLTRYDYHRTTRQRHRFFSDPGPDIPRQALHHYLQDEEKVLRDLPQFAGTPAKEIIKHIEVHRFRFDPTDPEYPETDCTVYFDYKHAVTGILRIGDDHEQTD